MTVPVRPGRIRRLEPATIERIAAGEVVERPASVVKELVENAYDAGARSVTVRLVDGGRARIEVADDGFGIPADELALALERHATSKLAPDGPLDAIPSLGFRGEALAAIAAVSRFSLLSRPPESPVGEGIEAAGGQSVRRFAEPRAPGTTVRVEELFFNVPARRKFLRAGPRELVEAVRTVEQLYLAHPEVGLRLATEAGEVANFPASSDLTEAAGRVLGPDWPARSFRLRSDGPDGTVEAVLGAPEQARPTSLALHVSVNGRPVASRPIAQAVRLGFAGALPRARFPSGVLHLSVPLSEVDVNVHPTKREVRLLHLRPLEDRLRRAIAEALAASSDRREPAGPGPLASPPPRPPPVEPPGAAAEPAVPVQRHLFAEEPAAAVRRLEGTPALTLFGSVGALYWVGVEGDDVVLVDQHAASERLLYDTIRAGGRLARLALIEPVPLALTAGESATLTSHLEDVREAGFEVEAFGPGTYRLRTVPTYRGARAGAEALVALLRELADGGRPTSGGGLEERRAASIACHAAIRAGDVVERARLSEILAALARRPDRAHTCPHGRPIVLHPSRARLDRWFLRSGT